MPQTATLPQKEVKKILVVEDEGEMGLLLNIFLDEKDMELDYVKDLLSAGAWLENKQPAVVILDNKLPDGFGVDFIGYIKKKYPSTKIIMISGFSSAREIALKNGADVFLEKPFSKSEFYDSIRGVLEAVK
jgi:two-component system, OmpR family, response regulator